MRLVDVLREHRGCQTVFGVVGSFHHFLQRLELQDLHHWTENLQREMEENRSGPEHPPLLCSLWTKKRWLTSPSHPRDPPYVRLKAFTKLSAPKMCQNTPTVCNTHLPVSDPRPYPTQELENYHEGVWTQTDSVRSVLPPPWQWSCCPSHPRTRWAG